MKNTEEDRTALMAFLRHRVESAKSEQVAFIKNLTEGGVGALANALGWHAAGALVSVYAERHAATTLRHVELGNDLRTVHDSLTHRLMMLASGHDADRAEMRAIAALLLTLRDWL